MNLTQTQKQELYDAEAAGTKVAFVAYNPHIVTGDPENNARHSWFYEYKREDTGNLSEIVYTSSSIITSSLPVYADGTARINALLDASLNVTIPEGIYMITGELNVRAGHVITAAAAPWSSASGHVILKAADSYTGRIITHWSGALTVSNITFDGNYSARGAQEGSVDSALVLFNGSSNVVLENNQFQYAPSFAIWSYRATGLQISGNRFLEIYNPIRIDGDNLDNTGTIENNTFKNTTAYKSILHIEALYTKSLIIRGNVMEGAGLLEPTSHGFEGTWGSSIYIFNSTGYLVENNKIGKNHWSSMVSGLNTTNGTIQGNQFTDSDNTTIAIWVEQSGTLNITVHNNELDGGMFVGDDGGDNLTITNNTVYSRGVGIDVSFATKTALIQGNKFYSKLPGQNDGMYLWEKTDPTTNIQVLDNHFEGFNNGIAINNSGGTGTVYGISLSGNTFSSNETNIWAADGITFDQPLGQ